MHYVKVMLARSAPDRSVLTDPRYVAEPKLDGQRGELHIAGGRTVACYSRIGRNLLGEKGLVWLREIQWPLESLVLDGELYAGTGTNTAGPQALVVRAQEGGQLQVALFDLLALQGQWVMKEPWTARRLRLEAVLTGWTVPGLSLVPISDDAGALWDVWVEELGGEGVMLKYRESTYVPGWRSPHWLKVKVEVTHDVVVTGITDKPTYDNGGYRSGEAGLTYGYFDPVTGRLVTVGQGIKFGRRDELAQYVGKVVELRCAGRMPSGALRHHILVRFRDDKRPEDCVFPVAA